MSRITEHKNAHLSTENMHEVKGFPAAPVATSTRKSMDGQSEFLRDSVRPNVISSIVGYEAPTTEDDGDIYLISSPELDIDGIVWQSGTTVRFTFTSGYDSSLYTVSSYLQISGADFDGHNGVHEIITINPAYLEVGIAAITDGTDDDASSSPATGYVTHQDFDPENLSNGQSIPMVGIVRYYVNSDLWYGDSLQEGDCFYNLDLKQMQCFNGQSINPSIEITSDSITLIDSDGWVELEHTDFITVTLPASPTKGYIKSFTDVDGICSVKTATIDGNGNDIDGSSTYVIGSSYETVRMRYNGTQWNKV